MTPLANIPREERQRDQHLEVSSDQSESSILQSTSIAAIEPDTQFGSVLPA